MSLDDAVDRVIDTCMKIQRGEKVVIVTDNQSMKIAKKIREALLYATRQVRFFNLDIYGKRPLDSLPKRIEEEAKKATATFFIASSIKGEVDTIRIPIINAGVHNGRHAHMVGLTEEIMNKAVDVDYKRVDEFTKKIYGMAKRTDKIRVEADNGTDFTARVGRYKWVSSTGICSKYIKRAGEWLNLPDGEIYTTPAELEGTAVIDGTMGDYFSEMFELDDIQESPLRLKIEQREKPTIVSVDSENKKLESEFKEYISRHECSSWIGVIGLGTNIFIKEYVGKIVMDRKAPNAHLTAGNPIGELTYANWVCPESADLVIPECDIWFDDEKIMENGRYLIDQ